MESEKVLNYKGGEIKANIVQYLNDRTSETFIAISYGVNPIMFEIEIYSESTDFHLRINISECGPEYRRESKEHPLFSIVQNILDGVEKNDETILSSDAIILLDKIYHEIEVRSKLCKDIRDTTFIYSNPMKSANKI